MVYDFYHDSEGNPRLHKSVVAFVDVLGFSNLNNGDIEKNLKDYHAAFSNALNGVGAPQDSEGERSHEDIEGLRFVKIFSDNILISHPVVDDGELELGAIFNDFQVLQMHMANRGFFVRGAITVGDLFVDETTIFGPALIEAYEAESTLAVNPRIILTKTAKEYVEGHLKYYGYGEHAPQNADLFVDVDGYLFLNYLEQTLIIEEINGPIFDFLDVHKNQIEKKLQLYKSAPSIFSKYYWSMKYHNYFCNKHRNFPEYMIDESEYQTSPSKLIK